MERPHGVLAEGVEMEELAVAGWLELEGACGWQPLCRNGCRIALCLLGDSRRWDSGVLVLGSGCLEDRQQWEGRVVQVWRVFRWETRIPGRTGRCYAVWPRTLGTFDASNLTSYL